MDARLSSGGLGAGLTTGSERQVADLLPIEVVRTLLAPPVKEVMFWFHTFALNRAEGIYTPGAARDHTLGHIMVLRASRPRHSVIRRKAVASWASPRSGGCRLSDRATGLDVLVSPEQVLGS